MKSICTICQNPITWCAQHGDWDHDALPAGWHRAESDDTPDQPEEDKS